MDLNASEGERALELDNAIHVNHIVIISIAEQPQHSLLGLIKCVLQGFSRVSNERLRQEGMGRTGRDFTSWMSWSTARV